MSAIHYRQYTGESDLPHIMALVQRELSEPYVIFTYRYFLHQWCVLLVHSLVHDIHSTCDVLRPHLSFLVSDSDKPVHRQYSKLDYSGMPRRVV